MNQAATSRPFGIWTATAMVVGGVIGAGIYVVPTQFAGLGWTGPLAWVLGGAGALVIGQVLAALVAARPNEPGLIAVIGEEIGSLAGVLAGWEAWVSYWCANAYIALTAARYGGQVVPGLATTPLRQAVTASLIIVALTALNLGGLKGSGRFQVVTTVLKLLPLAAVLVILLGLGISGGEGLNLAAQPAPSMGAILPTTTLAMVAIIGFEGASIAAERIREPERTIPRATRIGIVLCCLLYLVVSSGIAFSLPRDQLANSTAPVALFIASHWGPGAGLAVSAFAVISTVGCLNVWVLMQGEVPLGLVRSGQLPGWMGRTNARDIAVVPLVLASSLACAVLLLGAVRGGAGIMEFLIRVTTVSGVWIYLFAGLAALKAGVRPVLAGISVLFALAIMFGGGAEPVLLSLGLMATALPLYAIARRSMAGALPA